jgi:hypothetical protein
MRSWLNTAVFIALLTITSSAQTPIPVKSYQLHADKERRPGSRSAGYTTRPGSLVLLDADHNLVVLIPQANGVWVLKRLHQWETNAPIEETLAVTGAMHNTDRHQSAVIHLVDMRNFMLVSRLATTDPLLTGSLWEFDEHNDFVSKTLVSRFVDRERPYPQIYKDHYVAAVLSVPALVAQDRCEFDSVSQYRAGEKHPKREMTNVSSGCAALLSRTNVSSVELLPGKSEPEPYDIGFGCGEWSNDKNLHLILEECREGNSYADELFVSTSSHTAEVLSSATKQKVLSIPLSHSWTGVRGIIASVDMKNYVVLVKEGIYVEVYRLPN